VAYWDVPDEYGIHLPIVAMDMEFSRPVEVGDTVDIAVDPEVGTTSLGLAYTATHQDGETAYTGHEQHVCVSNAGDGSRPLPDELVERVDAATE
jgi:4-hydroxybenzoyl-CoA thioesterase